jgi:hypothetical protein
MGWQFSLANGAGYILAVVFNQLLTNQYVSNLFLYSFRINKLLNDSICKDSGTRVEVSPLFWGDPTDINKHASKEPSVIICSDVVYFRHLFIPVFSTLRGLLILF